MNLLIADDSPEFMESLKEFLEIQDRQFFVLVMVKKRCKFLAIKI